MHSLCAGPRSHQCVNCFSPVHSALPPAQGQLNPTTHLRCHSPLPPYPSHVSEVWPTAWSGYFIWPRSPPLTSGTSFSCSPAICGRCGRWSTRSHQRISRWSFAYTRSIDTPPSADTPSPSQAGSLSCERTGSQSASSCAPSTTGSTVFTIRDRDLHESAAEMKEREGTALRWDCERDGVDGSALSAGRRSTIFCGRRLRTFATSHLCKLADGEGSLRCSCCKRALVDHSLWMARRGGERGGNERTAGIPFLPLELPRPVSLRPSCLVWSSLRPFWMRSPRFPENRTSAAAAGGRLVRPLHAPTLPLSVQRCARCRRGSSHRILPPPPPRSRYRPLSTTAAARAPPVPAPPTPRPPTLSFTAAHVRLVSAGP
ncbi:hypothetical protein B0H13DRAFT_2393128 [Mycena leptocephala]|nr:hypothetical protein B0H13DRAFT_2393128 [Mycena leptocephala]